MAGKWSGADGELAVHCFATNNHNISFLFLNQAKKKKTHRCPHTPLSGGGGGFGGGGRSTRPNILPEIKIEQRIQKIEGDCEVSSRSSSQQPSGIYAKCNEL